jgi:dCTP deaminase
MILSDKSIKRLIQEGRLGIEPLKEENIQASSIDLTLGEDVIFYKVDFIDVRAEELPVERRSIPEEGIVIEPKSFLLATTLEYIRLPEDITAFVEGRSSLGRLL